MATGFTKKKVKRINQKKPTLNNNDVEKAFPKGSVKATPIKKASGGISDLVYRGSGIPEMKTLPWKNGMTPTIKLLSKK